MDDDDLPFGFDASRLVKRALDPAVAHGTLARHIEDVVARALNDSEQRR